MTNRQRLCAIAGGAELTLKLTDKQIDVVIKALIKKGLIRIPSSRSKRIELTKLGERVMGEMNGRTELAE